MKTHRSRVWTIHLMTAVWRKLVRPSLHRSFTTCATPGGHAATSSTRQALPTTCKTWKIGKFVMEICNNETKVFQIYWNHIIWNRVKYTNIILYHWNRNPDAKTVYIQNMSSLLSNERWFDIDWVRSRDTGSSLMLLQGACIALKNGKKILLTVDFLFFFFGHLNLNTQNQIILYTNILRKCVSLLLHIKYLINGLQILQLPPISKVPSYPVSYLRIIPCMFSAMTASSVSIQMSPAPVTADLPSPKKKKEPVWPQRRMLFNCSVKGWFVLNQLIGI